MDECGTHTFMTRLRARAPRGERAFGSVPRNRAKNTVLMASMTLEGAAMGACMAVEGSTKGYVFEAYVERFLAPSLRPGQVVVLDNLGVHKTEGVRDPHRGSWMRAVVPAGLLAAGAQPHRGGLQQGEGTPQEVGGAHTGSFGRGDGRGALFRDAPGRSGMVRSLRLRVRGPTFMNTAVRTQLCPGPDGPSGRGGLLLPGGIIGSLPPSTPACATRRTWTP